MAEVYMKKPLTGITLDQDNGHYVEGGKWDSSMLKGLTTMLMYVDPDEKNKGEIFKPTIEAFEKDLDFSKFQILVVLNLNATWKPNFVIESLLKDKMEAYPQRIYVVDKKSVLVKKWGLIDNEYNTLILNKDAKVLYSHSGEWLDGEMSSVNTLVRKEVNK